MHFYWAAESNPQHVQLLLELKQPLNRERYTNNNDNNSIKMKVLIKFQLLEVFQMLIKKFIKIISIL